MVASHRAQAQYARGAKDRAERLLALKAIPRQDFDRAVADDQLAQAELTEAEAWKRNYELSLEIFSGGDAIEGATAFAEKRKPVWKST